MKKEKKVPTAKETHVPVMANKMKISNHLASVIWGGKKIGENFNVWIPLDTVMQNCRIGFFSLKRKMDLLARSGGGLTPGRRVGFFIVSDFSASFPAPACPPPCKISGPFWNRDERDRERVI